MAFPIYSRYSNDLLVEKEIMTKSKSKLIKGTVTLKRLWNLFLGGLILDEIKLRVVPILRLPLSDLMRPLMDHTKHVELEKRLW